MGTTLKNKSVRIRKKQQCFACWRKFDPKTIMNYSVFVGDGDLYDCYTCTTCQILINEYKNYFYDECEGIFTEGCVKELMDDRKQKTPEELLFGLRNETIK